MFGGDACWEWQAAVNEDGYGVFKISSLIKLTKTGGYELAHRMAYRLVFRVDIPAGKRVLHTCDNPKCVRPQHLWLGTQRENVEDAARKGRMRSRRGEDSPRARLTDTIVLDIRRRFAAGERQGVIGRDYGLAQSNVSAICCMKTWKHVVEPSRLEEHCHEMYPVLSAPSKVLVDAELAPGGLVVDVEPNAGPDWSNMFEVVVKPEDRPAANESKEVYTEVQV